MEKDEVKYRILVIEDNPGDYVLIEDYLREYILFPEIIQLTSFSEVKNLASDKKLIFDTIFLDLSLPDMSGEHLIKEMLRMFPDIPIIVLTGYTDIQFSKKSISYGVADYLLKDELNAITLYKSLVYNIERKRIIQELKESEKRYNELFHMSPLPMWVFDVKTLKFLDVNDAAINHYGYTQEEFLNMTIKDIRPPEEIQLIEESISHNIAKESMIQKGVFKHKKKSGEIIKVDIYSRKIFFKSFEAKVILANDVTERLNHIQSIEEKNRVLEEIAWTQSHEVRAPLARIMGIIDLLLSDTVSDDERKEFLNYLSDSAMELDGIVKKIVNKSNL